MCMHRGRRVNGWLAVACSTVGGRPGKDAVGSCLVLDGGGTARRGRDPCEPLPHLDRLPPRPRRNAPGDEQQQLAAGLGEVGGEVLEADGQPDLPPLPSPPVRAAARAETAAATHAEALGPWSRGRTSECARPG